MRTMVVPVFTINTADVVVVVVVVTVALPRTETAVSPTAVIFTKYRR